MSRILCIVVGFGLFFATGIAEGAVEFRFSVAGLASNMPAETYVFGMRGFYQGSLGSGSGGAQTTDVEVTRAVDAFSPSIMNAVISGTAYPSATITFCKPDCTLPTYSWGALMQDVVLTNYNLSSGGGLPEETIGLFYNTMTSIYTPTPTPPRTAWGGIMPSMLPVGGGEPYSFDFHIDGAAAEDLLGRPLSPLGDTLPDTLFNISAVPEPATLILLSSGILVLNSRRRRLRP
jgi:type VI protein secretion system component Hcp